MRTFRPTAFALFLFLAALFGWSGCVNMTAANKESLLASAGFRERQPETPPQRELYAAAPTYQVQRVASHGKVFYIFKDEKRGFVYVGNEADYQRYQQLAIEQRIARDHYLAAEMDRDLAARWYGAFGSAALGPRIP